MRRSGSMHRLPIALWAALLLAACRAPAGGPRSDLGTNPGSDTGLGSLPEPDPDYGAIWTVALENDVFSGSDNDYTNGFAVSRTSRELSTYPEDSFHRRFARVFSFLPGVGDEHCENYLLFSLGQTMFTPDDIDDPAPPPGERPYAGVAFLDTAILSRSERTVQVWNLKLGIVGPSSGAEDVQSWIHSLVGGTDPEGWDTQLRDEPIVNVDYQYGYRMASGRVGELDWGVLPNFGVALGNYAGFANVGLGGRIGVNVPDSYGSNSVRAGTNNSAKIASPPSEGWSAFLYGTAQAFALGWFLPLDGNTFEDGPEVDSEDFFGVATVGIGIGRRGWLFGLTYSLGTDTYEGQDDPNRYGAVSLTWSR